MLTYTAVGDWRPMRGMRLLGDDESRAEHLIAVVRAFLATSALLMASFESTTPAGYASPAFSVLIAYVVFAAMVALLTRTFVVASVARTAAFVCDVSSAIVLTSLTNGPASPFFPFLVFVPMSAAYRWGAHETLVTSGVVVGALFAEAVAVGGSTPLSLGLLDGDFDASHAITRGLYVAAAGLVLAMLAQSEKQRRSEAAAIASIVGRADTPAGLDGTLESVLGSVLRTFGADRALLAMTHAPTARVFLWDAAPATGTGEPIVMSSELEPEQREAYFFEVPGPSWHALRFRSSDWFDLLAFDADGNRLPTHAFTLPASLLA